MEQFEITSNNLPSLSAEEFQTNLAAWCEDKGILSQLRAQLRFKLINVLNGTAVGRDIARKTSYTSTSLSKQAINLVVAEFLFKNKCEYSLSIFNSEVGLPSTYSENIVKGNNISSVLFDKENILNILELLGISKTSDLFENILASYYENNEETSLLSCLINFLSKYSIEGKLEPFDFKEESYIDLTHETYFIKQLGRVLGDLKLPPNKISHLMDIVRCMHKSELDNLDENYNKAFKQLEEDLETKNRQFEDEHRMRKVTEMKLVKTVKDYNRLKHHLKTMLKDKLINNENNKKTAETVEINKNVDVCNLDHCDNSCKENSKLVLQLQNDNHELNKENSKQASEIKQLQRKYAELLHDFNFLQKKVALLNIKLNEEKPLPHVNLKVIDSDLNFSSTEHQYIKLDATDSSSSLTEGIIREAKQKLEQLEKESKEIDVWC